MIIMKEKLQKSHAYIRAVILASFILGTMYQVSEAQQSRDVTGLVLDDQGSPLPASTVKVVGSTTQVITNMNGQFTVALGTQEGKLNVSRVGYHDKEVAVKAGEHVKVVLIFKSEEMDEVVVVGYGTQKRSHFTGASSSINADEEGLSDIPSDGLEKALYGRLAGVQIRDAEGEVGVAPEIRIRGTASFSASGAPLIVIDGNPSAGDLASIDMGSVESIEVLKDAASTAIYGSRGSNGVILVTTKSGANREPQFGIRGSSGVSNVIKYYDILDVEDFAKRNWLEAVVAPWETSFLSAGQEVPEPFDSEGNLVTSPNNRTYIPWEDFYSNKINPTTGTAYSLAGAGYYNLNNLNRVTNAPTPQESITNTGLNNVISVSAMGGNNKTDYFISGTYRQLKGVMINNNFSTLTTTINLNSKVKDNLKIEVSFKPSYAKTQRSANSQMGNALRYFRHPLVHDEYTLRSILRTTEAGYVAPWVGVGDLAKSRDFARTWLMNDDFTDYVLDKDGNKIRTQTFTATSAQTSYAFASDSELFYTNYNASGLLGLTWTIISDLNLRTTINAYARIDRMDDWKGSFLGSSGQSLEGFGAARYQDRFYRNIVNENTLNYNKRINDHSMSFLLGFSVEDYQYKYLDARGRYFENDIVRSLGNAGEILTNNVASGLSDEGLMSAFARANYSFKDRYLLSGVWRRDGSSQFGQNKRWGDFPSISVGWRINEEPFMKSHTWINELKLRASYGVTGNNRIPRYSYITPLNTVRYIVGNDIVNGYAPNSSTMGNQDIGWEQTNATNIGVTVGMLKNRINFDLDFYQNNTKSLLLENPIVNISGFDFEWRNVGEVMTKGVDFQLNSVNINKRRFKWETSLNVSKNINRLVDYGGTDEQFVTGFRTTAYRLKVGEELGEYYGYRTTGQIWKSTEDVQTAIANQMAFPSTVPGDLKLVDLNGDGIITEDDKTGLGSPYPDFEWGLTNRFEYKNFDLSFTFQGSHGSEVYNLGNALGYATLRWLKEDQYIDEFHGNTPLNPISDAVLETDYYVEDGSFVALRYMTVGYTFKKAKLRTYLTGSNLLYFMANGYRGINPEYAARVSGIFYGEQRVNTTALMRSFTFGLDFRF